MDIHGRWPHRWHSAKVQAFSSPIHGLGIIATESIDSGEVVLVYGGVVVPRSEILEYRKFLGHIGIQTSDDFFLVPTSREELGEQGIVNHSCEPNTGFRSQTELIAIHNIAAGEEITFDYAFCESFFKESFECKCGSRQCRKKVTTDDWKLPNIAQRYQRYYSPYLQSKLIQLSE